MNNQEEILKRLLRAAEKLLYDPREPDGNRSSLTRPMANELESIIKDARLQGIAP